MLVYGDAKRIEDPRQKAAAIRAGLERLGTAAPGIERHALLAGLLVESGELEQGILDARLAAGGEEEPGPAGAAATRLTRAAAGALLSSFQTLGALSRLDTSPVERALDDLLTLDLPAAVEISIPEGYAIYGLYPETYLCAAEQAYGEAGSGGPLKVIGIRSIGTSLAAAVAAVAGERAGVVSVRPAGHPFDRRLAVGPRLGQEMMAGERPQYAVVDEGPGLSGSSFGSVGYWLEDRGVPPEAIAFFPSHRGGPGPQASERHRQRWERARRHVAEFETVFASPGARWPLERWVEDLTGEAEEPLEDLSAGRWREKLFSDRPLWPPADVQGERRKYLLAAGGRRWLLKFAGLGRYGREKLALARELEGWIPPTAGLRHGFLIGLWLEGVRPLPLAAVEPQALLDAVASYLAFRAERLPASPQRRSATPLKLFEMAAYNTRKALGPGVAGAVESWRERLPEITRLERPVLTDNKLHAWEWLVTPEGKILKADALDHHQGNDLVGPQDLAWDLAGAAVELDLEPERLAAAVARLGNTPCAERVQLDFYTLAYLAFQTGRHSLAAEALEHSAPEEAARLRAEAERYSGRLQRSLVRP